MTKIEVTCPEGHKFWMEDYESKACPKCGRLVIGPKAKKSASGPCILTTACVEAAGFPDNCTELESMRYLRDEYLMKSEEGRKMIEDYYEIAPIVVEAIKKDINCNKVFNEIFYEIRDIVLLIKLNKLVEAAEQYKQMVAGIKQRYALAR